MTEEEILINIKEMINICDSLPSEGCTAHIISNDHFNAVKGLLDLYNKEKEKNQKLKMENSVLEQVRMNLIKRIDMKKAERHSLLQRYDKSNEQIASLKKEIEELNSRIDLEDKANECLKEDIKDLLRTEPNDNFISKDKIREIIGWKLVIKDEKSNNYRPIKNTSAQDVYEAFYKIRKLLKE